MRALLKQHMARGHVEIRVSLARDAEQECCPYNRDSAGPLCCRCFARRLKIFGLDSKPDLNALLQHARRVR